MDWIKYPAIYTSKGLNIKNQSIVEKWEKPIQEILVNEAIKVSKAKILEIGYGLGFAAREVVKHQPTTHFLIEAHPSIAMRAIKYLSSKTSILLAFWQDVITSFQEEVFDSIIFDAYPLEDKQFDGTRESTFNYVRPFLRDARSKLKTSGKLSFIDFSCQLHLLQQFQNEIHRDFSKCEVVQVPLKIPKTCMYAKGNVGNVVVLTK